MAKEFLSALKYTLILRQKYIFFISQFTFYVGSLYVKNFFKKLYHCNQIRTVWSTDKKVRIDNFQKPEKCFIYANRQC